MILVVYGTDKVVWTRLLNVKNWFFITWGIQDIKNFPSFGKLKLRACLTTFIWLIGTNLHLISNGISLWLYYTWNRLGLWPLTRIFLITKHLCSIRVVTHKCHCSKYLEILQKNKNCIPIVQTLGLGNL